MHFAPGLDCHIELFRLGHVAPDYELTGASANVRREAVPVLEPEHLQDLASEAVSYVCGASRLISRISAIFQTAF